MAVRDYPPLSFPPSSMWRAMEGAMSGIYEARTRNETPCTDCFAFSNRKAEAFGLGAPTLALLSGGTTPVGEAMADDVYEEAIA